MTLSILLLVALPAFAVQRIPTEPHDVIPPAIERRA